MDIKNFKLLGDKLLVEADTSETKTSSGLVIAKTIEPSGVKTGTVLLAGPGKLNESSGERFEMTVKTGDKIVFNYGTPIDLDGKSYLIVSESDEVLLVV